MKRGAIWSFLVLVFVVAIAGAFRIGRAYAQPVNNVHPIPLSWGSVKATMGSALVLEAADGTVRIYDLRTQKAVLYYRLR